MKEPKVDGACSRVVSKIFLISVSGIVDSKDSVYVDRLAVTASMNDDVELEENMIDEFEAVEYG